MFYNGANDQRQVLSTAHKRIQQWKETFLITGYLLFYKMTCFGIDVGKIVVFLKQNLIRFYNKFSVSSKLRIH